MPKAAVFVALALMLLTGLVIGSLKTLSPPQSSGAIIPVDSDATSRTAEAFYEAIDMYLETGDESSLRHVVQPAFVDHASFSDEPGTVETLETWLRSVRDSAPKIRFTVAELVSRNDLIAVELEQPGAPAATLAGLPLAHPSASSGYELLRIDNGLVIERWASPALPGLIETAAARFDTLENAGWIREPRIERMEFPHQATFSSADHMGTVLIVESGALNLSIPSRGHSERLEPGAIRTIPPKTRYTIWNRGQEPVSVISLTIVPLNTVDYSTSQKNSDLLETGGVQRQLLAGGATIRPEHGPFQLEVGHALALPGTNVPQHKVNELEVLFVTRGTVEATLDNGYVFSLSDLGGLKTEDDVAAVGPDQAISAGFGVELAYEVVGEEPAEFWLITIMPE